MEASRRTLVRVPGMLDRARRGGEVTEALLPEIARATLPKNHAEAVYASSIRRRIAVAVAHASRLASSQDSAGPISGKRSTSA